MLELSSEVLLDVTAVDDGDSAGDVVSDVGAGAPGGSVAATLISAAIPKYVIILLTGTQGRGSLSYGRRIPRRTGIFCAVIDRVTPVRDAAETAEIHSRTSKLARQVVGVGNAFLLHSCQLLYIPRQSSDLTPNGMSEGHHGGLTPQGSRLSNWALAETASDSTVRNWTPFMVALSCCEVEGIALCMELLQADVEGAG